jgi:hypothetical protein
MTLMSNLPCFGVEGNLSLIDFPFVHNQIGFNFVGYSSVQSVRDFGWKSRLFGIGHRRAEISYPPAYRGVDTLFDLAHRSRLPLPVISAITTAENDWKNSAIRRIHTLLVGNSTLHESNTRCPEEED